MYRLKSLVPLLTLVCGLIASFPTTTHAAPPIAVFGREDFFTLDAGITSKLKNSGFNTAILFVVDVNPSGDLNYNGNHLIVTNGVYMGDANWGARLAALKVPPTSITRIEVCTGGAGAQSWANIKNLIATNGIGPTSLLYRNFLALKNALGIDAIDNDDEVAYDATSAATFNNMITSLGMKNTLCPYNNSGYWQSVFNNSAIDAVYLQCYDGGAGNNPATWNSTFGGFRVAPGDWSNDGLALVESKFNGWSPIINGGFIWQFEFISASDLAAYGAIIKKAVDPLVVTPSAGFTGIAAYNQYTFPASTPFVLTNRGTASLDWSLISTSSWLSVSSTLGTLAASNITQVTVSLVTNVATNLAQGVYSANVIFSNKTSGVTVTRTFGLNTAVANWPIAITGNNAAILASNNATTLAPGATAFDIPNNYCFVQLGWGGSSRGLPLNGVLSSKLDSSTAFQLGPYGATDALMLGNTYPRTGTLTLANPDVYNSLAILASSANGGGQGTFFLNYTNGTKSQLFNFNSQDWFFVVTNVAIQGFGRFKLGASLSVEDNGDTNPNMYQTTVNLAALGITQAIASITFSNRNGAGATETAAIFGVSGMPASIPLAPPQNFTVIPGTNATVKLAWKPVSGAVNYNVWQTLVSSNSYSLVTNVAGTNCTVTGLLNGTTYYFVVTAVGTISESANSAEAKAMPGSYLGWALAANPVAYWPLGDAANTTVATELIQGSNGVYASTTLLTTGGAVGDGFGNPHRIAFFNGSTTYGQVPRLVGQTNFSISFWLRTGTTGNSGQWYSGKGIVDGEVSGAQNDFGISLVTTKVAFGVGNTDTTLLSVKSVNDNAWHQVVATRDSGNGAMKLYIDGALDSSTTGPTGPKTSPTVLRLASLQTGGNLWAGSLSDLAMYQTVLSSNQIATLYSAATGIFYDVTLSNQWDGTSLVLRWPGNGKLLEATNFFGPWTTNVSKSPVTVLPSLDLPEKYYKIQTQ